MFGRFLFIAQYLQLVLGLSPLEAGLWTLPWSVAFIVGLDAGAGDRAPRPPGIRDGAAAWSLAAVGFGLLTQVDGHRRPRRPRRRLVGLSSLGLAPVFTLATDLIVGAAPPERAGAASAISETGAELGGALGIAILGSIGTAVYRGAMARR